jgi:GxxExxY protein
MGPDQFQLDTNRLTEKIINCVYRVSNTLGSGFLEKVYENALATELLENNLRIAQQYPITVFYKKKPVGVFVADLLVEDRIIVEVKAVKALDEVHSAQCMNYMKATGLKICLLVNFGKPRAEIKRIVLDF